MIIASLSPFLNEEREEISAIGLRENGRETVFVRFGRRKPRKQIGRALCKLNFK